MLFQDQQNINSGCVFMTMQSSLITVLDKLSSRL